MRNGRLLILAGMVALATGFSTVAEAAPISVYGAWHCENDYCTWGTVRSLT
jgi:hypothetical protein